MNKSRKALPVSAKTGAFMKGILGKGPMVEIAIRGLSEEIPDSDAETYATRLISKCSLADLHGLLISGGVKPEKAQSMFARKMLEGYESARTEEAEGSETYDRFAQMAESLLCSGCITSESAQEDLVSMLAMVVSARVDNGSDPGSDEAMKILRSGNIASKHVRDRLAWCVYKSGDCAGAVELFRMESFSDDAQEGLAQLLNTSGTIDQVCEAFMNGIVTSPNAQRIFATRIFLEGDANLARAAILGDAATDPEAVITLKQTLKG